MVTAKSESSNCAPPLYFRRTIAFLRVDNPVGIFLTGAQRLAIELAYESNAGTLAGLLVSAIVVLGLFGALHEFGFTRQHMFDLDAEWVFPALFSAGLLWAAGGLAVLAGDVDRDDGHAQARIWWRLVGLFFIVMGIDELTSIHERLEKLSGADWQTIYLPIVILAAPAWLFTAWRLWRHRVGYVLYGTGAVLWVLSQALEKIQWGVPHLTEGAIYDYLTYDYLMISEEVGEMLGSMLFGLAILRAIQRSRRDRSA